MGINGAEILFGEKDLTGFGNLSGLINAFRIFRFVEHVSGGKGLNQDFQDFTIRG